MSSRSDAPTTDLVLMGSAEVGECPKTYCRGRGGGACLSSGEMRDGTGGNGVGIPRVYPATLFPKNYFGKVDATAIRCPYGILD